VTAKTTECAVLFADIADSTGLYDRYGDMSAQELVMRCLECLSEVCERYEGSVLKTVGDEIMCRFPSAESAVRAASAMNMAIETLNSGNPDMEPVAVRVGFHYGEVIEDHNDLFGDAVNLAARMTEMAKGQQVITTEETVRELPNDIRDLVRRYDQTLVKGRQALVSVYEVLWDQKDATSILTGANLAEFLESRRLRLRFQDQDIVLLPDSPALHIGRVSSCDLVVNSLLVSRIHALLSYRRGKFVIVDQSTNGTYVRGMGGNEVYLRREDLPLWGRGVISLGQAVDKNAGLLIHYACE